MMVEWDFVLNYASKMIDVDFNDYVERVLYFDEINSKVHKKQFYNKDYFIKISVEDWEGSFEDKCFCYINNIKVGFKIKRFPFCIKPHIHKIDYCKPYIIRAQKTKFIDGVFLKDTKNPQEYALQINYYEKLKYILNELYQKNIKHEDISIDHNIIIKNEELYLIDYESMYIDEDLERITFDDYLRYLNLYEELK